MKKNDLINNWVNKIIKGDNVDIVKQTPDKSIDLFFTDRSYFIKINKDDFIFKEIINNIWRGSSYE